MIHEVTGRDALPVTLDPVPKGADGGSTKVPGARLGSNHPESAGGVAADRSTLEHAVQKVREAFDHMDSRLKIEIDPDLHRVVVKIIDQQSGELIRQVPAQEMLEIAKRLDVAQGLLLTKRT